MHSNSNLWLHTRNIFIILTGAFISSLGLQYFAIPNHLGQGGFTGISLLIYYFFNYPPGLVLLILNIPLLVIGYNQFGKKTLIYTIIAICSMTLFMEITKNIGISINDVLLVSVFAGVLVGLGFGVILRVGGTTGGFAIIARLTNKYFGWGIGQSMFFFDTAVIAISILVIGLNMAMYTLIAVFICARVIDFVVEGINSSKAITIISEKSHQLAYSITTEMNRGATIIEGIGSYTKNRKEILYVVVAPTEVPKIQQLVLKEDPHGFIVVHDARDVLGKGFSFSEAFFIIRLFTQ